MLVSEGLVWSCCCIFCTSFKLFKCWFNRPQSQVNFCSDFWNKGLNECVANTKSQSCYSARCDYRVASLNTQGNIPKESACVRASVCFDPPTTPGERNRRVYKLNANNIHQPHFSFGWRAVMCSTSKACFICGISGNKGFSKYGKQTYEMRCTSVDKVMS